jgi:hypothetical protein
MLHADDYIGYSDKAKLWWDAEADSGGDAILTTSKDNVVFTLFIAGCAALFATPAFNPLTIPYDEGVRENT